MNRVLTSWNYTVTGDQSFFRGGGWIHDGLRSSFSKRRYAFGFIMLTKAFARLLLADLELMLWSRRGVVL